jgi:hypothetical protein
LKRKEVLDPPVEFATFSALLTFHAINITSVEAVRNFELQTIAQKQTTRAYIPQNNNPHFLTNSTVQSLLGKF